MSVKREFERTPFDPNNHRNDSPSAASNKVHEAACEENAVKIGIMSDRDFSWVRANPTELEPRDDEHVWLFVPARTSKRSIVRIANECGSRLVRFFLTVRCLSNYIFSDLDVVFHLNISDARSYLLPAGSLSELQVHTVSPEGNQEVLRYVLAQRVVPPVPAAEFAA